MFPFFDAPPLVPVMKLEPRPGEEPMADVQTRIITKPLKSRPSLKPPRFSLKTGLTTAEPLPQSFWATLQASILANTTQIQVTNPNTGQTVTAAINSLDFTQGYNCNAVAAYYSGFPNTNFWGNYAEVPVATIRNCIRWKKLTTAENPPTATSSDTSGTAVTNFLLNIQANVQMLVGTGTTLDCTQRNIVQGLSDALSAVPSGAAAAQNDAGWATAPTGSLTMQQSICRLGTIVEQLFATITAGTGTGASNTTAATFTWEGPIDGQDVQNAVLIG